MDFNKIHVESGFVDYNNGILELKSGEIYADTNKSMKELDFSKTVVIQNKYFADSCDMMGFSATNNNYYMCEYLRWNSSMNYYFNLRVTGVGEEKGVFIGRTENPTQYHNKWFYIRYTITNKTVLMEFLDENKELIKSSSATFSNFAFRTDNVQYGKKEFGSDKRFTGKIDFKESFIKEGDTIISSWSI